MNCLFTKLHNLYLMGASVLLILLIQQSSSFAQGGTWTKKADIPTARNSAASCELDGKIYVIGGCQDLYSSLYTMEVYDPVTDIWDTTKAPMSTARTEMCVAAVNGKIYAIGGAPYHYGKPVGMVAEYDPLTDTWDTTKAAMPTPREVSSWGVFNNKIYIAGGNSTLTYTLSKKLEIYDPATDTWTTGADMLEGRYAASGVFLNDTLYVIGGVTNSPFVGKSEVQKYDPITDSWSWGTSLLNGRVGHTAVTLNDYIYVLGGDRNDPITIMWNVERYDPQTKNWTEVDTIPSVMCSHTANTYGDEIYAFSGSPNGVHPASLTDAVYSYKPPDSPTDLELHNNILPDGFVLHQNYPNPFNPVTTIKYSLPHPSADGEILKTSDVKMIVYDVLGREVATLVNEKQKPGNYEVDWNAKNQPSGIYFYQLQAGPFVETKKMLMIK